jgi:hypothetical protein
VGWGAVENSHTFSPFFMIVGGGNSRGRKVEIKYTEYYYQNSK